MSSNEGKSFSRAKKFIDANENVHWMPAKIDYCGMARVDGYFESTRKIAANDSGKETAAFRGRPLDGARLEAPAQYAFHLISGNKKVQKIDQKSEGNRENYEIHASQKSVQHWNLDCEVSEEDAVRRIIDFVSVANEAML